jgi:pilus assembly protein Flp/PilA
MTETLRRLWKDEEGASLIEYVLIAGLLSIAGYTFLKTIGEDMVAILTKTNTATTSAKGTTPAP